MKAIRYHRYGPPDVLEFTDADMPAVGDDDVLVRVKAASVNPLDWHFMRGTPYLLRGQAGLSRPKDPRLGVDMAGVVTEVGRNVTGFRPGDEVFGAGTGAFAEYLSIRHDKAIAPKPASLTFEQAAAVPVAGFTALQALRDKGHVRPGSKVLINGASGGVGTFAVQVAKALGTEVTAVCSARNVATARSLGADRVIDYTQEDFTQAARNQDVMLDIAGTRTLAERRRVLARKGTLVFVGGPDGGAWLGPMLGLVGMLMAGPFVSQRMVAFLAHNSKDDLVVLSGLITGGKVTPVIDRAYSLSEVPAAIRYLEEGHAQGKVVISV
ncbi:MAG TPA: NAD(P)-dependent alcohol dehydrogenase [Streptosporangiaceae bacterium]|nr:NAD(P)-dependent alcohol dehydrogenase [Streptosporangiaceae bacterium]